MVSSGKRTIARTLTDLFPVWMIVAGCLAIIYPRLFTWFSGPLITWGLAIIMLGMGITLTPADFERVIQRPWPVFVGFAAQYLIMPALGYTIACMFAPERGVALGLILVSCCPGGTASNVVTYLARGDVALSVTMTACSTVAAVVVTPLLTRFLAGTLVHVDAIGLLMNTAQVVLIPVLLGLGINRWFPGPARRVQSVAPLVSVLFIVLIVASVLGSRADDIKRAPVKLVSSVLLLHGAGFALGYSAARLVGMDLIRARTISIEVGMQNSGLGTMLARNNFPELPSAPTPCAMSAVFHSLIGSALAGYWRWRSSIGSDSHTTAR